MKEHFLIILTWAVGIGFGIFLILRIAFSDHIDIFMGDASIMETKPWRPASRVIFGSTILPIYLAFVGWFMTALYRDRSRQRLREHSFERRNPKSGEQDSDRSNAFR